MYAVLCNVVLYISRCFCSGSRLVKVCKVKNFSAYFSSGNVLVTGDVATITGAKYYNLFITTCLRLLQVLFGKLNGTFLNLFYCIHSIPLVPHSNCFFCWWRHGWCSSSCGKQCSNVSLVGPYAIDLGRVADALYLTDWFLQLYCGHAVPVCWPTQPRNDMQ